MRLPACNSTAYLDAAILCVRENGADAYGRRAFARGSMIRYELCLPRALAVRGGTLTVRRDGEEKELVFSLSFYALQNGCDVYGVTLDSASLEVGLYFCTLSLQTAYGTRFAEKKGGRLFLSEQPRMAFQLSLYERKHQSSDWLLGGVIYHVFVDRFFRGGNASPSEGALMLSDWENGIPEYPPYPGAPLKNNTFFGGDLDGVRKKLPYIAALGVRAIYLSPIFRSPSNHKYDTADYLEVDSMFGGNEALSRLIEEAERYSIRLILDGVFNHTGADSRYFNRYGHYPEVGAYQSKASPYFDWYSFSDYPNRYEAWWGIPILPRLNLSVPTCRDYFVGQNGVISHYAKMGIGGMRLDVADELDGSFIASIKQRLCESVPDAVLYGEVWEDASNKIAYDRRTSYYSGAELDGVMNYPLRTGLLSYLRNGDAQALSYYLGEVLPNMPKWAADLAMNLLGTHDTVRVLTALGGVPHEGKSNDELAHLRMTAGERARAIRLLRLAYLVAATLPGVPSVYYGDEVGLEGYFDPFNRRPFPWHAIDEELLSWYRMLAEVRKHPVYREGELRLLHLDGKALLFVREGEGEYALTACNNDEERQMHLTLSHSAFVLTERGRTATTLTLLPKTGAVLLFSERAEIALDFSYPKE